MKPIRFSHRRRPDLSLELNSDNEHSKHGYTTGDLIHGKSSLRFHEDTIIDNFSITLEGRCTSVVTTLSPWGRESPSIKTTHTFLVMQQPIELQTLPSNRLASAGSKHTVPFCFTVPEALLPDACKHGLDQESPLSKAHRRLPPTLGISKTKDDVDDQASESVRVEYNVFARLKIKSCRDGSSQTVEKETPVRIEPIFEPDPPLVVEDTNSDFRLNATADFRGGVVRPSSSDGYLVLQARQPSPLRFSRSTESNLQPIPTTNVNTTVLFFSDQRQCRPPRLESVKVRLRVFNYSAAVSFSKPPRPSSCSEPTNLCNTHSRLIDLGTHLVNDHVWTRCSDLTEQSTCCSQSKIIGQNQRDPHTCDSRASPQSNSTARNTNSTASIYETNLNIPITLSAKIFDSKKLHLVPTFNSCLVARNYALELTYNFGRSSSTTSSFPCTPSKEDFNLKDSDDIYSLAVSRTTSKPRILSTTKKLNLILPLQIVSDNSHIESEIGSCSRSSSVDDSLSRPYISIDGVIPSRTDSGSMMYAEKVLRQLENEWDESPPSYYPDLRAQ